jgi:DSF synthase
MQLFDVLLQRRLRHLKVSHDQVLRSVWIEFIYGEQPCFSNELIEDVWTVKHSIQQAAQNGYRENHEDRILFQVLASTDRKVFSLGGDLAYFIKLIEENDRAGLRNYARRCADTQYASASHYGVPFTTIALVAGEALGGGFEAALAANILVAEKSARFGFPEITFGMFPGMGGFSFLVRRINPAMARRMILNHRVYTATELYEMGVVDILAPDGEGREAVNDYMQRHISQAPGRQGFQAAVDLVNPVSHEELYDIVELWVEASLKLSKKNRRLMEYFSRAQARRQIGLENMIGSTDYYSA